MPTILSGTAAAAALRAELKTRVEALYLDYVFPVLATVRIGEDGGAVSYEKGLLRAAQQTGVRVRRYILPDTVAQQELSELIDQINADPLLSGLLLLRPLPKHLDEKALSDRILPQKDVDCANQSALPCFTPCTAEACMALLRHYEIPCEGRRAVVVGRSKAVGLPTARLLLNENATVTVCHSKTRDLPGTCRTAELLVAATGRPGLVTKDCVTPDTVVLDVGVSLDQETGKYRGDVSPDAAQAAGAVSPVPGGVGALTSTILMRHVIDAAERSAK